MKNKSRGRKNENRFSGDLGLGIIFGVSINHFSITLIYGSGDSAFGILYYAGIFFFSICAGIATFTEAQVKGVKSLIIGISPLFVFWIAKICNPVIPDASLEYFTALYLGLFFLGAWICFGRLISAKIRFK